MGPFFPSPEEAQAHFDKQIAAQHAAQQATWNLFTEITPDHLATLIELLSQSARDSHLTAYYHGLSVAVMKEKHKRCVCGEDHDFEALEAERLKLETERLAEAERLAAEKTFSPLNRELVDKDALAMDLYHLVKDNDTGAFKCTVCGMGYPSLDDRMLRRPDDCSGCKQKAAWG